MKTHKRKHSFSSLACALVFSLSLVLAAPGISFAKEANTNEVSAGASTEVSVWQEKGSTVVSNLPKTGDDMVILLAGVGAVALASGVLAVVSKRGEKDDAE